MFTKLFFSCLVYLLACVTLARSDEKHSLEEGLNYQVGRAIFEKIWVSSPSSTTASDGLGPLYNARSCVSCHHNGGRGRVANSLVLHINDDAYGEQIQTFSVPGMKREAEVAVHYKDVVIKSEDFEPVVLHEPEYTLTSLEYGVAPSIISPRIASSLAGLGWLALIPEQRIASLADEDDKNGDGISGRMNKVWDAEQEKQILGRFGWKASQSTLKQQTSRALNIDLGISSSVYPDAYGDCTQHQQVCLGMPNGNSSLHDGFEASELMLENLLFYVSNVPAPSAVSHGSEEVNDGLEVFNEAGCNACHHRQFEIGERIIQPFTDLLLHDMGDGLADGFGFAKANEGLATGREWRTAPLWGVGQASEFLHDGRAKTLQEAIFWHGGEAENSLNRYKSMEKSQRDDLIRFLNDL